MTLLMIISRLRDIHNGSDCEHYCIEPYSGYTWPLDPCNYIQDSFIFKKFWGMCDVVFTLLDYLYCIVAEMSARSMDLRQVETKHEKRANFRGLNLFSVLICFNRNVYMNIKCNILI
jgi:hypothetical protein